MVGQDCGVRFEVVVGVDGVVRGCGAVTDAVEDGRGHEGAVEEGGAALRSSLSGHGRVLGIAIEWVLLRTMDVLLFDKEVDGRRCVVFCIRDSFCVCWSNL